MSVELAVVFIWLLGWTEPWKPLLGVKGSPGRTKEHLFLGSRRWALGRSLGVKVIHTGYEGRRKGNSGVVVQ